MAEDQNDKDIEQTDSTETDDAGAEQEKEWTPPTKDDWDKVQRALTQAKTDAKTNREKLRDLQTKSEDATGKAAREQAEAAERKFKPVAVRAAAKAALLEAGLQSGSPERVAKLVRMLDLDTIAVDDDGDVVGLDDQVASIKADYPELFTPTEKKVTRVDGANKQGTNGRAKTASEIQAAQLLGRPV